MNLWTITLWIHLLAVVAWIGGMIFLTLVLVPVERGIKDQRLRYELLNKVGTRFKYLGWGCIIILVLTGSFNAIQKVSSWEALLTSGYGKTLLLKLFLVFDMVVLSMVHDFYLGPRLVYNAKVQGETSFRLTKVLTVLARGNLILGLVVILLGISLRWGGIF